ncbi:transmembrane protein, putative (macronuclear) [Tetrahymena thermophila SB210]|uniref:Transmembrane protein, putative n=1 Tax=Tetrahymena thermophila (strain SB210) TaxID=312017 RepID=W7XFC9_TETTS|nr:transmembrane protein, putative [Tetrahymena thermophila SB210]EWS72701.1 transmembrane protein, putative [Tetrahymena thermophila SB210]|eukprot:XP_012654777.1 transmembrane protein, putative [Tetrahymena thermophila SB210]
MHSCYLTTKDYFKGFIVFTAFTNLLIAVIFKKVKVFVIIIYEQIVVLKTAIMVTDFRPMNQHQIYLLIKQYLLAFDLIIIEIMCFASLSQIISYPCQIQIYRSFLKIFFYAQKVTKMSLNLNLINHSYKHQYEQMQVNQQICQDFAQSSFLVNLNFTFSNQAVPTVKHYYLNHQFKYLKGF